MNKILFIANYKPASGGISTQVDILNKKLQDECFVTGVFSFKGNILYRIKAFFRLIKIGKKYDVFHIHACSDWGFLPAVVGIIVGKLFGKRIILTYHGGGADAFFKKHTWLVKKFLCKTDTNIVLSGYLEDVFKRYDIPCVTIPNIIEFKENVYRERMSISPAFISIRSFTPTYNILCTIKAFDKVKQLYPQASLTLLGDGPLRVELESYVKEQHIPDVIFIGCVPNEKIYEYLDKADIMLSSPNIDNMPMSLLEGFNSGLLVISSNVGGVPYMIQEGVNGMMFASNNSDEMAEKMLWALFHQDESIQMIKNAKDEVKKYSWEKIRSIIFTLYD